MSRNYQEAIVVESVAEEYAIIQDMNCECGGNYKLLEQALVQNEGKYYDVLTCECENCGTKRDFIFDINLFFGKELKF